MFSSTQCPPPSSKPDCSLATALGARLLKAVASADAAIAARLVAEQENRDFRAIGGRKTLIDGLNGLRKAL